MPARRRPVPEAASIVAKFAARGLTVATAESCTGGLIIGALTEISAAAQLLAFRREVDRFRAESFPAISGAGEHGAIVHYRVTPQTDRRIAPDEVYTKDRPTSVYMELSRNNDAVVVAHHADLFAADLADQQGAGRIVQGPTEPSEVRLLFNLVLRAGHSPGQRIVSPDQDVEGVVQRGSSNDHGGKVASRPITAPRSSR